MLPDVNIISVFVAALAAFFIGFMWHGPVLGKQWMKLMKMTTADMEAGKKEMEGKMPFYMITAFLQQVVTAYVMAMFAIVFGVSDVATAVILGFLVWLGFIATTLLNGVLWEKRTMSLYLFNIAYHLVSLVVISLIVSLWR